MSFVTTHALTVPEGVQRGVVNLAYSDVIPHTATLEERTYKLARASFTITSDYRNPGTTVQATLLGIGDASHGEVRSMQRIIRPIGTGSVSLKPRISRDWDTLTSSKVNDTMFKLTLDSTKLAPAEGFTYMMKVVVSLRIGRSNLSDEPISGFSRVIQSVVSNASPAPVHRPAVVETPNIAPIEIDPPLVERTCSCVH